MSRPLWDRIKGMWCSLRGHDPIIHFPKLSVKQEHRVTGFVGGNERVEMDIYMCRRCNGIYVDNFIHEKTMNKLNLNRVSSEGIWVIE